MTGRELIIMTTFFKKLRIILDSMNDDPLETKAFVAL
jgi:hypothetical protein